MFNVQTEYSRMFEKLNATHGGDIKKVERALIDEICKIEELIDLVQKSQNFRHTNGTTQTNTNNLNVSNNGIQRTTRAMHQQMVADCAMDLVLGQKFDGIPPKIAELMSERTAKLAYLIGMSHDIGHCLYGHDGEEALGNSLRCQKVTPAQRDAQQQMRNKYFGKAVSEGEQSYEEQQRTQNKRVNDHTTENGFLFDHGEESAWAFINICESNGYDIGSSVVNEAIQGILFHSRPDFKTNSPAVQAVQISDSMAFIQDDYQQFVTFGKMPEAEAKKKFLDSISDPAERYEMEKFLTLSPAMRLKAAQQEVIDNYDKTHVLQNGQHFVDEAWIVDKMMRRLNGNQTPTKEELAEVLKEFNLTVHLGVEQLDEEAKRRILIRAKTEIMQRFKRQFPVNYRNHMIKESMNNPLIFGEKIGNNMNQDKANAEFLTSKFMIEFAKIKGFDRTKMNEPMKFQDFIAVMHQTQVYHKLKKLMQKGELDGIDRGMDALSGYRKNGAAELTDLQVLECLGFNISPDGNIGFGVLDNFTPNQLIVKMVAGLTNEFSRAYAATVVKGMSVEEIKEIHQSGFGSDVSKRGVSSSGEVLLPGKNKYQGLDVVKLNAKGLLYVGVTVEQLRAANVPEEEIKLASMDFESEVVRQNQYLEGESASFDTGRVIGSAGVRSSEKDLGEGWDKVDSLEQWEQRAYKAQKIIEQAWADLEGKKWNDRLDKVPKDMVINLTDPINLTTKEGLIRAYQNVQAALKCIQKHKASAQEKAGQLSATTIGIGELSGADKAILEDYKLAEAAAREAAIKTAREREAREYGVVQDVDALQAQADAERQLGDSV